MWNVRRSTHAGMTPSEYIWDVHRSTCEMFADQHMPVWHRVNIYDKYMFADQYMPVSNTEWIGGRPTYQTQWIYMLNALVKCSCVKWASRNIHAEEMPSMYVDGCWPTYGKHQVIIYIKYTFTDHHMLISNTECIYMWNVHRPTYAESGINTENTKRYMTI